MKFIVALFLLLQFSATPNKPDKGLDLKEAKDLQYLIDNHQPFYFYCGCCSEPQLSIISPVDSLTIEPRTHPGEVLLHTRSTKSKTEVTRKWYDPGYIYYKHEKVIYNLGWKLGYNLEPCISQFPFSDSIQKSGSFLQKLGHLKRRRVLGFAKKIKGLLEANLDFGLPLGTYGSFKKVKFVRVLINRDSLNLRIIQKTYSNQSLEYQIPLSGLGKSISDSNSLLINSYLNHKIHAKQGFDNQLYGEFPEAFIRLYLDPHTIQEVSYLFNKIGGLINPDIIPLGIER